MKHERVLLTTIALLAAPDALAATLDITSVGLYDYDTITVSGSVRGRGAVAQNVLAGPILFEGTTDRGKPFSAVAFCFDFFHDITVALGSQYGERLTYSIAPIATDNTAGIGAGNPLDWRQRRDISGLAQLGAQDFLHQTGDIAHEGPAIQAAIWHDEYGLNATFGNAAETAFYNRLIHEHFNGPQLPAIIAVDARGQVVGGTQGQVLGSGFQTTPEPGSLALMMGSVALAAVAARRLRRHDQRQDERLAPSA